MNNYYYNHGIQTAIYNMITLKTLYHENPYNPEYENEKWTEFNRGYNFKSHEIRVKIGEYNYKKLKTDKIINIQLTLPGL